jgi:hypothetical protein
MNKMNRKMRVVGMAAVMLGLACGMGGRVLAASAKKQKEAPKAAPNQFVVLFDFESDLEGWRIPDWAFPKSDNASVQVNRARTGSEQSALQLQTHFPAGKWSGAYVEVERGEGEYLDFSGKDQILADVYVSTGAPVQLKGKFIITVGSAWAWTEMRQPQSLKPGQWTTLKANITEKSTDWQSPMTPDLLSDVRKVGIRVESPSKEYKGHLYVDNVRLAARAEK